MKVKVSFYSALVEVLGPEKVLTDSDSRRRFATDASRLSGSYRFPQQFIKEPQAVVKPTSTEEVAAVVKLAGREGIPIVPYGGGTGVMGGAVSVAEGIVVDLKGLNRILEVSREDMTARVQAGVILKELELALNREGLILGHDPWSLPIATVGGAISTNGLGYRGSKYGSMGDQVLGLEVVLPQGEVLRTRSSHRSTTGFPVKELFIGAEGTLGIITEATLQVFPAPEKRSLHSIQFPSFEAGFQAVTKMFHIGLAPAMVDFGEDFPRIPLPQALTHVSVTLYLAFEGFAEEVEAQEGRALKICKEHGGKEKSPRDARRFWDSRHQTAELYRRAMNTPLTGAISGLSRRFEYIHIDLPISKVPEYRRRALDILDGYSITLLETGLWTQPELFSMVMASVGLNGRQAEEVLAQAVDELLTLVQDMGGSMEHCHGVGLRLAHLMGRELGNGLEVMRRIKAALDPSNIMNPGKLGL